MKLFLNGGGDGKTVADVRKRLNKVIDHNKKVLYIPFAWLDETYKGCLEFMTSEFSDVDTAGIEMVQSKEELINKNYNDYVLIYIDGGNTYNLLKTLKDCGAFDKFKDYLINRDGIAYGVSAEAIIFGKDLDSCNTDDSNDVGLQDNSGFNMVNEYSCYVILLIEIKQELKIVEIF